MKLVQEIFWSLNLAIPECNCTVLRVKRISSVATTRPVFVISRLSKQNKNKALFLFT
jgi:hypothetical protein